MHATIDTGAIVRRTGALLQASPLPGLLALAALIIVNVAGKLSIDGGWVGLSDFAALAGNYLVVTMVMRQAGLFEPRGAPLRILHFLGVWLLTGVPILTGLLLLILPGLYLWSRWILVVPLVLGGGRPVLAAIGTSWRQTRSIAALIRRNEPDLEQVFA